MNLDGDTLGALGFGCQWDSPCWLLWTAQRRAAEEERQRVYNATRTADCIARLRAVDTAEANRERKRQQRERDPEHQRRLAREAQRRRRERLRAAEVT